MLLLLWIMFGMLMESTYQESTPQHTFHNIHNTEEARQRQFQNRPLVSEEEVEECFKEHANVEEQRLAMEEKLAREGRVVRPDVRSSDINIIRRSSTDPHIRMRESKQLIFETVADTLIKRHNLSKEEVHEKLPQPLLPGESYSKARQECSNAISVGQCDANSRYRTADGTCNNLLNTDWGSTGVCLRRILAPSYVGQSGFRQSVLGGPLPPPRDLSVNVHNNMNSTYKDINHLYMFFGQLLDHDIALNPSSTTVENQAIQCCPPSNNNHPQCAPINIPQNDYFFSQFGTTCMNFVRSAICPTCVLGSRQQINQVTAFIDASFVYGNSENETRSLRTLDGTGKLRSEISKTGELLPPTPDPSNDLCSFPETNEICFQAGDVRVNQHPPLTSLQTLFLREHNRLATELRKVNQRWDDERIFQEARRIVGAEMQAIVYKEYLPITLGNEKMKLFELDLSHGGTSQYNNNIDPSLYNEFSTAAFRFGHSLVNSLIAHSPLNSTNGQMFLRDSFRQPFDLRWGIIGPLLKGVARSSSQRFDRNLVADVTNFLYRRRGNQAGLDLTSINIQRGRDHGLPPYVEMLHFCKNNSVRITRFEDLARKKIMTYKDMRLLKKNYRNVNDIDLWTGCLNEINNEGAVIGPTAICIIGLQFQRLKFGDRFYFEHRDQPGSFTNQQMQQLREVTLSKIICLNTDADAMPENAMLLEKADNKLIFCCQARGVDMTHWKE